jgi:hypothetical protein
MIAEEEVAMPLVYRVMKKDEDDLPVVGSTARCLGARPGTDIGVTATGDVILDGQGLSVSPGWRVINPNFIPRRLKHLVPRARGSNNDCCFRSGEGAFVAEPFASGIELVPDSATHGPLAPAAVVPLDDYQSDLAATRDTWQIDEA